MNKPETMLWLDDHRGVYIPRDFANSFADRDRDVSGITISDTWTVLETGPDHQQYWDAWDDVLDNAIVTIEGVRYRLHQDGDLWLVPEGMEWSEENHCFQWPKED